MVGQPSVGSKDPGVRKPKKEKLSERRPRLEVQSTVDTGRTFASSSTQARATNAVPRPPAMLPSRAETSNGRDLGRVAGNASGSTVNTAGSLKRPSPFGDNPFSAKKTKKADAVSCVICGNVPYHLIKSCPLVIAGPTRWAYLDALGNIGLNVIALSVSRVIRRLEHIPSMNSTVDVLRAILAKQMVREARLQPQA
jgi:chromodomain-helicase-DNA-binding protein 4